MNESTLRNFEYFTPKYYKFLKILIIRFDIKEKTLNSNHIPC